MAVIVYIGGYEDIIIWKKMLFFENTFIGNFPEPEPESEPEPKKNVIVSAPAPAKKGRLRLRNTAHKKLILTSKYLFLSKYNV